MNRRMILYILAKMMGVEGVLLLLPAFVGLLYGEKSGACFLFPATILALIYIIFGIRKPNKTKIYAKEGMIIVASAWILWSMFGAIPFTLGGYIPNYLDAFLRQYPDLRQQVLQF